MDRSGTQNRNRVFLGGLALSAALLKLSDKSGAGCHRRIVSPGIVALTHGLDAPEDLTAMAPGVRLPEPRSASVAETAMRNPCGCRCRVGSGSLMMAAQLVLSRLGECPLFGGMFGPCLRVICMLPTVPRLRSSRRLASYRARRCVFLQWSALSWGTVRTHVLDITGRMGASKKKRQSRQHS